ncbi:hypothetical protein FD722_10420 [Photobacterium damselae subsp. damselae]|nr:hypothetical protein FD719_08940 [Photobacterium damselae subsp. damselae]TLS90244.1 hypothetical protein FD722_10420 [Photobacterium damselae subsp. damselae]
MNHNDPSIYADGFFVHNS